MKKFTKFIFASLLAALLFGAVVSPAMTPAFAATQSTGETADQEQQKPPTDDQGSNAHSDHHG